MSYVLQYSYIPYFIIQFCRILEFINIFIVHCTLVFELNIYKCNNHYVYFRYYVDTILLLFVILKFDILVDLLYSINNLLCIKQAYPILNILGKFMIVFCFQIIFFPLFSVMVLCFILFYCEFGSLFQLVILTCFSCSICYCFRVILGCSFSAVCEINFPLYSNMLSGIRT